MKTLHLLIFILLLTSCGDNTKTTRNQSAIPEYFEYDGKFNPAFLSKCEINISKSGDKGFLKLKVWEYPFPEDDNKSEIQKSPIDTEWVRTKVVSFENRHYTTWQDIPHLIIYRDSVLLSEEDFELFFNLLDTIQILKLQPNENYGMDGITVVNKIKINEDSVQFKFWSPYKEAPEQRLVEAIFALCRNRFKDELFQEYFETLEQYFNFGLPCKIISKAPLEIRIYGTISADEHPDLIPFIYEIPSDKPVLLDMRNFDGLAAMYFPTFQELCRRNKSVIWVAKDKKKLGEIGIDTNLILNDIHAARQRLK
jgi:hypothetical protein